MMSKNIVYIFFFGMLFYSCENNKPEKKVAAYFDLKSYFEQQASALSKHNFRVKKFVLKDSSSEEKVFDHPDWKEELKPFSECDINKPSWKNSYSIDSTLDAGTLCIKYVAKDSSLKIKNINFCYEHDSLTFIRIEKWTDNMYYDHFITLNYFPMKAYTIQSSQKITFTKNVTVEVKALFLR